MVYRFQPDANDATNEERRQGTYGTDANDQCELL